MITFSEIEIDTYDYKNPTITWDFEENIIPDGITVNVYRSQSPEPFDQFDEVETGVSPTAYSYTDTSVQGLNQRQYNPFYYILEATDGAENTQSDVVNTQEFDLDIQAKLMLEQKRIGLKHYGRDVKILKRRYNGERCPDCWDETLQRETDENCPTCNGTGTVDGYYDPITVKSAIRENPRRNEINRFGTWQDNNATMSILNYPPLSPDDLVIEQNDRRWKVVQVRPYRKKSAILSQDTLIALQDKESGVYEIL